MTFHEWWVLEFGRPPLAEERDIFARCKSAFNAGHNKESLTFKEKGEQLAESNDDIIFFFDGSAFLKRFEE